MLCCYLLPAEIIKYGLIRDAPLFEWLEQNMDRLLQRDPEVGRGGVRSMPVEVEVQGDAVVGGQVSLGQQWCMC